MELSSQIDRWNITSLTRHTTGRFEHDGDNNHNTTNTNMTRKPNIKLSQRIEKTQQQTVWAGINSQTNFRWNIQDKILCNKFDVTHKMLYLKRLIISRRVLGRSGILLVWFRVWIRVVYIKKTPNIPIRTLVKWIGKIHTTNTIHFLVENQNMVYLFVGWLPYKNEPHNHGTIITDRPLNKNITHTTHNKPIQTRWR